MFTSSQVGYKRPMNAVSVGSHRRGSRQLGHIYMVKWLTSSKDVTWCFSETYFQTSLVIRSIYMAYSLEVKRLVQNYDI